VDQSESVLLLQVSIEAHIPGGDVVKGILTDLLVVLAIAIGLTAVVFVIDAASPFKLVRRQWVDDQGQETADKRRQRRSLKIASSALVVGVTVVGALYAGVVAAPGSNAVSPANHKSTGHRATHHVDVRFLRPQDGSLVKECPPVTGSGQIPADMGLWIVVVPDTSEKPKQYWIESQAKMDGPGHWSAISPVYIDARNSNGVKAQVYAILLNQDWSNYLAASTSPGGFFATQLPPGSVIGPVNLVRVADPRGASCRS